VAKDESVLDLAELPQKPVDPFQHSGFHSSVTDVLAVACLLAGAYFLIADGNLVAFLVLFFAFAFLFQPFHPH